jgi:phosphoglycerate dehydrogenase-like enzyme
MPDASVNLVSLAELLEKSDYVSLHTPLVRETHHVI